MGAKRWFRDSSLSPVGRSGKRSDEFWIVVDSAGEAQARMEAASRDVAERIAWAVLPELEAEGRVINWFHSSVEQRIAAKQALKITRALCVKRGMDPVCLWAAQLQEKFMQAGGAR